MTAWMLWAVAITALLGAAAHLLESVLLGRERPGRWVWAVAIIGAIGIQAWALLAENLQPRSVTGGVEARVPAESAASDWWNGIGVRLPSLPEQLDALVGALWLAASLVLLVGLIGGFWRLRRRAKAWPRCQVAGHDVLISENFGPALLGILTPRIVLPQWLSEQGHDAVALVCLHEAEHRKAGDTWLLAGAALLVALLPWNAALWWQLMRLRAAIELDCDRRVIAGGVQTSRYAGLLLNLGADSEQLSVAIPAFVQPPTLLERRLTMLIIGVRRKGPVATLVSVAATALLGMAACEASAPALAPDPSFDVAASRSIQLPSGEELQRIVGGRGAPLILVDGERLDTRDPDLALEGLDRDDVESIEVIKGPAAIELYGADALGGVIRINLKRD